MSKGAKDTRPRSYSLGGQEHGCTALAARTLSGRDADRKPCATSACARSKRLAAADVIACEDSRVTRKLTEHYGIETPLTPYHEHNAAEARPKLLARLGGGQAIALVSDAGTPLISDPGYKLVRAVADAGHASPRCPAPRPCLPRSASPGCRPTASSLRAFCRRNRRRGKSASPSFPRSRQLGAVRERAARRRSPCRSRRRPRRPRDAALCRELTKLHEEITPRPISTTLRGIYASGRRDPRRVRHRHRAAGR